MFTHAINVNDIAITKEIYDGSTITNVTFPAGTLFFFKYATTLSAPGLIITPTGDMYSVTETATLVITATKIGTVGEGGGSDSQIEVIVDINTALPSDMTYYEEGQKTCVIDSSSSTDVYKVYTATNGSWDSGVYLDRAKLYMVLYGNPTLSLEPGLYGVGYTVGVEHSESLYYYAPTSTGIGQSTTNTFKDLESGTYLINASTFIYPTKIRTTTGVINQTTTLNIGSNYYYLSIYRADTSAKIPSSGDTFMIISPTCSVTGSVTGTSASGLYTTVTWDVTTGFVDLTSNQTISGVKTFSSVPVCAIQPTSNDELANKAYVDAHAGGTVINGNINTSVTNAYITPAQFTGKYYIDTDGLKYPVYSQMWYIPKTCTPIASSMGSDYGYCTSTRKTAYDSSSSPFAVNAKRIFYNLDRSRYMDTSNYIKPLLGNVVNLINVSGDTSYAYIYVTLTTAQYNAMSSIQVCFEFTKTGEGVTP